MNCLEIYHEPSLRILDHARAAARPQVHYQFWRNMVFSEFMAREDHPKTQAFHVNLVRKGHERASADEFHGLVNPEFRTDSGGSLGKASTPCA